MDVILCVFVQTGISLVKLIGSLCQNTSFTSSLIFLIKPWIDWFHIISGFFLSVKWWIMLNILSSCSTHGLIGSVRKSEIHILSNLMVCPNQNPLNLKTRSNISRVKIKDWAKEFKLKEDGDKLFKGESNETNLRRMSRSH